MPPRPTHARYGYNNYGCKWNYTFIDLGARASYHASQFSAKIGAFAEVGYGRAALKAGLPAKL